MEGIDNSNIYIKGWNLNPLYIYYSPSYLFLIPRIRQVDNHPSLLVSNSATAVASAPFATVCCCLASICMYLELGTCGLLVRCGVLSVTLKNKMS